MKPIQKIIKKAGPFTMVVAAAVVILLLLRMQPKVSGGRSAAPPAVNSSAVENRELTDMRAEALLPWLQRLQQKNSGAFTVNAADTSGKTLRLQFTDEAAARTALFADRAPTAEQQRLYKANGIQLTAAGLQLPLQRKNGVLLVKLPAIMAFALAGE